MWVLLTTEWNGIGAGQILKVGYYTGISLISSGRAVESEPPKSAAPKIEQAIKSPHEKR